jgi:uncharacterized protein
MKKSEKRIAELKTKLAEVDAKSPEAAELHYELSGAYFEASDLYDAFHEALFAEKLGSAKAAKAVGICYWKGLGCEANPEQALLHLKPLIEKGDAEAYDAFMDIESKRFGPISEVVPVLKAAADAGLVKAQIHYGCSLLDGFDIPQDVPTGLDYLEKARKAGSAEAIYDLGVTYDLGEEVEKDDAKAFNYYLEAANMGDADAQYALYKMYSNGCGCTRDAEKAFHWVSLAADQCLQRAVFALGVCYENGDGCAIDLKKAKKLYAEAKALY